MVAVLMGDKNGREIAWTFAQTVQAHFRFPASKPAIHKHAARVPLHDKSITATATTERCKSHSHRLLNEVFTDNRQHFPRLARFQTLAVRVAYTHAEILIFTAHEQQVTGCIGQSLF